MKSWEKITLAALALCALLLAGVLALRASAASGPVYLMAVNDTVVETTAENMPRIVDGKLYVPYIMLSNQVNGFSLGVSAQYSSTRRTVLVSNGQRGIVFDTQANTARDLDGNPVQARAMVRNSMAFLPIDYLCSYFSSISCSRTQTQYGTLVRITNDAAVLSDQRFVDAADTQLSNNLRRYLAAGGNTPVPGPSSSPQVEPSAAPSQAELYLAFRSGPAAREYAQLLEGRGQRALFLFTVEELAQADNLARALAGTGHTLGLALTGEDVERCLAEAARGRELAAAFARYHVLVVSAPGLDAEGRKALEEAGYVLWDAGVHGKDFTTGRAMVEALSPRQINYVEMECGTTGAAFLRSALAAMDEENCQVYQPTAPALQNP